jgi:cation:H+ antiporter
MFLIAVEFIFCAVFIVVAGVYLSRYGDVIAVKTGIGRTWMGVLVMAAVTSLPELVTGVSSIVIFDVADIAAGDAIGSCMFNLLILAFLDVRDPEPLAARVHQGHVLSAAFGIVLLGLALMAMLAGPAAPVLGWIGVHSLVFLTVYAFAMRTIFVFERTRVSAMVEQLTGDVEYKEFPLKRAVIRYAAAAAVLVTAATYLPGVAERFAAATGLGQSFVGSLFVAASTSMPEVVVSVAAARIGALDMAVGNLFGSNLFNIAVLGFDDVLYARGSMLADVEAVHLVSLTSAMVMTAIAIIGLTYRARHKRFRLSWDTFGIAAVYALGVILLRVLA